MPKLTVSLPDSGDVTHELTEESITLGRLPDNLIQIDDASVSSHHAQLTLVGNEYTLTDLDSTNGTKLNGQAHTEGKLRDGDEIIFGSIGAVYVSESPADARPMPQETAVELQPAAKSIPPANFENASPFQTRKKKKDPTAVAILALAGVSILIFAFAVFSVFGLKSPL